MSTFIKNLLANRTITVQEERILDILGLTGSNRPSFIPPLDDNDSVTINLDNISQESIDIMVEQFLDTNWDDIQARLSPDQLYIECTVVDGVDDPAGKWPKSLGNVAVLESSYILRSVAQIVPDSPQIQDIIATTLGLKNANDTEMYNIKEHIESLDINAYALMVIIQYAGRFEAYVKETNGMNQEMILFTNAVSEAIGVYYPAEFQLPIQEILVGLNYLRTFLDQVCYFFFFHFKFILIIICK